MDLSKISQEALRISQTTAVSFNEALQNMVQIKWWNDEMESLIKENKILKETRDKDAKLVGELLERIASILGDLDRAKYESKCLNELINTPLVDDFLEAVKNEAAHQRKRWGDEHDGNKDDADWYWLIGYVAGKAMRPDSPEKQLHHIITTAAVCFNWFRLRK